MRTKPVKKGKFGPVKKGLQSPGMWGQDPKTGEYYRLPGGKPANYRERTIGKGVVQRLPVRFILTPEEKANIARGTAVNRYLTGRLGRPRPLGSRPPKPKGGLKRTWR